VHLDGARIFNAAVALNNSVKDLCKPFETVMFCLSKGLCAPVGSILLASSEKIGEARKLRKMLGGGMRQAGVLAAAGLIALEEMPKRLHEDHDNARFLAQELTAIPGITIDIATVQTNIVIFNVDPGKGAAGEILSRLKEQRILMGAVSPCTIRAVTHADVNRKDMEAVIAVLRKMLE
jgi:threonine aldolase